MAAIPGWFRLARTCASRWNRASRSRIAGKRLGQDLQRHLAVQLGIGGLVDLSHPALADEGGDVVVAEPGAYFQGHDSLEADEHTARRLWSKYEGDRNKH